MISSSHTRRSGQGKKQKFQSRKPKPKYGNIRKAKKAPKRFDDRIIRHLQDFFDK